MISLCRATSVIWVWGQLGGYMPGESRPALLFGSTIVLEGVV